MPQCVFKIHVKIKHRNKNGVKKVKGSYVLLN